MERSDINSVHLEYVTECKARRNLSPEERKLFDIKRDAPLRDAQVRTDPERTARWLCKVAWRLQDGETLSPYVLEYIANALVETAINHEHAGAAFGLVRSRGGPPIDSRVIVEALETLRKIHAAGTPFNDNKRGKGAYALAAKQHGISVGTLENRHKNFRAWQRTKDEG